MRRRDKVAKGARWPLIVFGLMMLAVVGVGSWLMIAQDHSTRRSIEADLLSICKLKVEEIAAWRTERLGDATVLTGDPTFADDVGNWLSSHSDVDARAIVRALQQRVDTYGYSVAGLLDTQGNVLLSAGSPGMELAPAAREAEAVALQERRAVLSDLHTSPDATSIRMDAVAPISPPGQTGPTVCVILRSEASTYLYPLISSWPVPRRSAETLLVRRDGNDVLYLNELRFQGGDALKLRVPLTRTDVPAVKAVLGQSGIVEGLDYRGEKVLASLEPVPSSNWFVVAKIDVSEALGPARSRESILGTALAVLLVALMGGAGFFWQRNQKLGYAAAFEDSLAHQAVLERFQYLVQEAQDAIILSDADSRIIEVNERACALYGYSRDEFLRLHVPDLVPPEMLEELDERFRLTRARGATTHEMVNQRKDGTRFPVEVSDRVFEVGGTRLVQAIIRDTSERKRAEQERLDLEHRLQHSQRLESLGVLAGGIAHDFNNILTAIMGYADLTLRELPPFAPSRSNLREIVNASRRAADLCQQMLAYSGRGRFVVQDVDVNRLIRDLRPLLDSSVPKKVTLQLDLAEGLPAVEADPGQLTQVVMNLVINAAEAVGAESGTVTISSHVQECTSQYLAETTVSDDLPGGTYVAMEVTDTGEGMTKETMEKLFEPFFSTKFTGRGLGLSAVLGIVRGHHGAIRVYSEIGKGTTFRVLLPATQARVTEPVPDGHEPGEQRKGQGMVLLVDDEGTIRTLGRRILERLGFEVLLACHGREAVDLYEEHAGEVVLVVLDLTMPDMDGEEALRALRQFDPNVRVLLASGFAESELIRRFSGENLAGFIQKPYSVADLEKKVRRALG